MTKTNEIHVKKLLGLIMLGVIVVAALVLGAGVWQLAGQTREEMATTPTPVPVGGNIMAVTLDPAAPTPEPVLRNGSGGDSVKELQARLQALGYYDGDIDGQYGSGTTAAVKSFQQENGIGADGITGAETRTILYSAQAKPNPATPTPVPTDTPAPVQTAQSGNVPGYDLNGLPMLVNKQQPLPDGYTCAELVNMTNYCDASVVKIKASGIEGERTAVDALMTMLRAAQADGIATWQVSAGWRSVGYQEQLLNNKIADFRAQGFSASKARSAALKTVAEPGTSEHHTGLAFDITVPGVSFKGTDQYKWISKHCWEYGFILRYPDDKEKITGFVGEAWHYRYVGTEHSLKMRDEGLCLEEYIEKYGPGSAS